MVGALAFALGVTSACDGRVAAPVTRPRPELAPPHITRLVEQSGRTNLVAIARAADPTSGELGAYQVVTEAQARARLARLDPGNPEFSGNVAAMDHGGPWYVAQPGALRNSKGNWSRYEMHGADNKRWATWEFYCNAGGTITRVDRAKVDSLWNSPVANTGGHLPTEHTTATKPVQEHWLTSGFTNQNRVFVDTIWGNIASGDEIYRMAWTDSMPSSPCYGLSMTEIQTVATRYLECCMTPLTLRPSFIFATIDSDHGYPFYMNPLYVARSYLTADYAAVSVGEAIEIEAGSLIYGGLNDVRHNWQRPHQFHRTGADLDLDNQGDDDQRKLGLIRDAGHRAGFRSCFVETRNHVHCNAQSYP